MGVSLRLRVAPGAMNEMVKSMRTISGLSFTRVLMVLLCLSAGMALAQNDPGNTNPPPGRGRSRQGRFDPAQFQERMMSRYRERLEVTDDAEWKAMEPLIQHVMDARMAMVSRGGFGRRNGRNRGEANPTSPAERPSRIPQNAAAEDLQKAIDSKAPPAEMKAALARYNSYRKAKQADLEKARDELRAVLTSRQEAIATLSGLL